MAGQGRRGWGGWRRTRRRQPVTEVASQEEALALAGVEPAVAAPKKRTAKPAVAPPQLRIPEPEELAADGTLLLSLVLPGRPMTKKTHSELIFRNGRPLLVPSKQFQKYQKDTLKQCKAAWEDQGKKPIDFGVGIRLRIFLPDYSGVGDHCGHLQAQGDLLQEHGVLANDSWIQWLSSETVHWFGGVDAENPRAEIEIIRLRHPMEEYRANKLALAIQKEEERTLKAQQRAERAEQRAREAVEKAARREAREKARAEKLAEQEAKRAAREARQAARAPVVNDGETEEITK